MRFTRKPFEDIIFYPASLVVSFTAIHKPWKFGNFRGVFAFGSMAIQLLLEGGLQIESTSARGSRSDAEFCALYAYFHYLQNDLSGLRRMWP